VLVGRDAAVWKPICWLIMNCKYFMLQLWMIAATIDKRDERAYYDDVIQTDGGDPMFIIL